MRELCPLGGSSVLSFYKNEYMRLGIDYSQKAILNLRANLWFPYNNSETVFASVELYYKSQEKPVVLENLFVHRPYPNKNILCIGQKFGRKTTKKFIPIVFDSQDKLEQLEKIIIIWKIEDITMIIVENAISIASPKQDGIYSLWSYDHAAVSDLKEVDGRLESETDSVYDSFYFFLARVPTADIEGDRIAIVEAKYGENSNFRYNLDESQIPSLQSDDMILQRIADNINDNIKNGSAGTVCYYYAKAVLSDDVSLP